jgi:hypothetical protein
MFVTVALAAAVRGVSPLSLPRGKKVGPDDRVDDPPDPKDMCAGAAGAGKCTFGVGGGGLGANSLSGADGGGINVDRMLAGMELKPPRPGPDLVPRWRDALFATS